MDKKISWVLIGMILILPVLPSVAYQVNSIVCRNSQSSVLPFDSGTIRTSSTPVCYIFKMPSGSRKLVAEIERVNEQDTFSFYFMEGNTLLLEKWRENPLRAGGNKIVTITKNISEGKVYTVSIASPVERGLRMRVNVLGGTGADKPYRNAVNELQRLPPGVALAGQPIIITKPVYFFAPLDLHADPGSQALFPIRIAYHGPIEASFSWTGTARNLKLSLYQSDRWDAPKAVTSSRIDESDGSFSVKFKYQVTNKDIDGGTEWWLKVINVGGGSANGDVAVGMDPVMSPRELHSGDDITRRLDNVDGFLSFIISVPDGSRKLSLDLSSITEGADFDLFARRNQPILRGKSDWKSRSVGPKEQLQINNPAHGLYYIQVRVSKVGGQFNLRVEVQ